MSIFNPAVNGYPLSCFLWNIFLIIIPFFLCAGLGKLWFRTRLKYFKHKLAAGGLGLLWLLFIPNTAYIMTVVRHLLDYCPDNYYRICAHNAWMIIIFFTYAVIGWVAFVYLVNQMKSLVNSIWGKAAARVYIWTIIPFISLGVMLGLVNRWHSWEIFVFPGDVAQNIILYFVDPINLLNWLVFTVFFYFLYFGGNWLFRKF